MVFHCGKLAKLFHQLFRISHPSTLGVACGCLARFVRNMKVVFWFLEAMQQSNNVKSKMAGMMTCIKGRLRVLQRSGSEMS